MRRIKPAAAPTAGDILVINVFSIFIYEICTWFQSNLSQNRVAKNECDAVYSSATHVLCPEVAIVKCAVQ